MTTSARTRWLLAKAEGVAQDLVRTISAVCERVQIAGSIRRRKPEVGDIELVCLPKYIDISPSSAQPDMFRPVVSPCDTLTKHSCLDAWVFDAIEQGLFRPRPDARNRPTLGPLNKLLVHVETGIAVDIFTATPENFGMSLFVRTGPAEWNIRAMAVFRRLGMRGHAYGGVSLGNGREVSCPTEQQVFDLLGWPWVGPEDRA